MAAIVFVQGAGVAEAAPNADGQPRPDTDIAAQGAGNLVSGFFRGLPVGGSVGQTALNVRAGGRTRWAAIFSGVWMLVILAALSPLVAKVAVPTLAAVLIFAAAGALRVGEVRTIVRTGRISQIAVTVDVPGHLVPAGRGRGRDRGGAVAAAAAEPGREGPVGGGTRPGGRRAVHRAPRAGLHCPVSRSPSWTCTAACSMRGRAPCRPGCPTPPDPARPAVVLRLRGRTSLGATFLKVVDAYAERLAAVDGRLYLSGLDPSVTERLRHTGRLDGPIRVFEATPLVGESTEAARHAAQTWLVRKPAG